MSVREACTYGETGVHQQTKWSGPINSVQASMARRIFSPIYTVSPGEESVWQFNTRKSVEPLVKERNHVYQDAQEQQAFMKKELFILLRDCEGKFFDNRVFQSVELERGNILRLLTMESDEFIIKKLRASYGDVEDVAYMRCVDINVYARVSSKLVFGLSENDADILRAITDVEKRLHFFSDIHNFRFVQNLQIGSKVFIQTFPESDQKSLKEGHVSWIGELPRRNGIYFGIRVKLEGRNALYSSHVSENAKTIEKDIIYVTGDNLRCPDNSDTQASSFFGPIPESYKTGSRDESNKNVCFREVPIRRISGSYKVSDDFSKLPRYSEACESQTHMPAFPHYVSSEFCELTLPRSSISYNIDSIPLLEVDKNEPLQGTSGSLTGTARYAGSVNMLIKENDVVLWEDLLSNPHVGIVRWFGHLEGLNELYAVVEFEKQIACGTTRYEGCNRFSAKPGHAGLVPLSALKKAASVGDGFECGLKGVSRISQSNFGSGNNRAQESSSFVIEPPTKPSDTYLSLYNQSTNSEKPFLLSLGSFVKGSCVIIKYKGYERCGVVKWIGNAVLDNDNIESAAVEIESPLPDVWKSAFDKPFFGDLLLSSSKEVALVPMSSLFHDSRFPMVLEDAVNGNIDKGQMGVKSDPEKCYCVPTTSINKLVGREKGIQGYKNSCYLDSTLYAMFVQCTAFDQLLRVKKDSCHSARFQCIQVLETEIVYPLRRNHYVSAASVTKFRELLQSLLPKMPGLTSDEKDPEELLIALFNKVFVTEPFLTMRHMNDGKTDDAFICPLITDDVWSSQQKHMVCVQSLLERSLYLSNTQFAKEPKILILQLPRYGKEKVFCKVVPQQELDVTHLIYNMRRPCVSCNKRVADRMCPECFLTKEFLLGEVTYCEQCYKMFHKKNPELKDHEFQRISSELLSQGLHLPEAPLARHKLQLSAVLSIETSHYVAFVRVPSSNKWLLYDSMADRVGLESGHNVPVVKCCDRVSQWLSESGLKKLRRFFEENYRLPPEIESDRDLMRMLSDCYICFYISQ